MIKTKIYRYLGRNGIITSPIFLESIEPITMFKLIASEGKILTNGEEKTKAKLVFADEIENWFEVDE